MGELTPEQASAAMRVFDRNIPAFVKAGFETGLNYAGKLAVQKYQVGSSGGSRDPFIDPPNRPPGPLKIRSGRLRRSTKPTKVKKKGDIYIGGLQASAPYAAIHEFGGRTKPHVIMAKGASVTSSRSGGSVATTRSRGRKTRKVLRFRANVASGRSGGVNVGGAFVFTPIVFHPGSNIPARPYLKPALEDATPMIEAEITRALIRLFNRVWR
jgi:phage gpG-like protein